jgi:muconolactone delta-isomerase
LDLFDAKKAGGVNHMKILALEKEVPGVSDEQFTEEILGAEARKAWELYQSGVLRELYFSADKDEAVLVLECESTDEARRALSELPLVCAGLIDFQVIPLVAYPGFARLFGRKP